jgi:hypothetical protein
LFYKQQIVLQFVHFHFLSQLLKRKSPLSIVHHRWQMRILFASTIYIRFLNKTEFWVFSCINCLNCSNKERAQKPFL